MGFITFFLFACSTSVFEQKGKVGTDVEQIHYFELFSKHHRLFMMQELHPDVILEHIISEFDNVLTNIRNVQTHRPVAHKWSYDGKDGELLTSWVSGRCVEFTVKIVDPRTNDHVGFSYTAKNQFAKKGFDGRWYTINSYSVYWQCGKG